MIQNKEYISALVNNFVEYFKNNSISDKEEKMLLLNYFSPSHTITSELMASAMGWPNFNSANLHYGTFASKVAKIMGFVPPNREYAISFFADFNLPESGQDHGHWQWIMHSELAEAINLLGWNTDDAKKKMEAELSFAETMLM